MDWIMIILLGLGGLICCANFYLSFLQYPVHRLTGGTRDDYRHVSGIPIVGSPLVAISLFAFWQEPWLRTLAMVLIVIDTGGLHWFAFSMAYHAAVKRPH